MASMEIPHTALSQDALQALVEEFVLREGTDYGEFEVSLEQKTHQILRQLDRGDIVIVYDSDSESCTIQTSHTIRHQESGHQQ